MEGSDTEAWKAYQNREVTGTGWVAYGGSQMGCHRALNEDCHILLPLKNNLLMAAVADGLGGHNAGHIASKIACETLYNCARQGMLDDLEYTGQEVTQVLESILLEAHQAIANTAQGAPALEGMGCTLTVAIVSPSKVWFCHVGDSRLYQLSTHICQQLTRDQRFYGGAESESKPAQMVPAAQSGHFLEHALGLEEENNLLEIEQGVSSLCDGDSLLLCSDGLCDRLSDARLAKLVRRDTSPVRRVHDLIESALQAGSSDDITAVLISISARSTSI